MLPESLTLKVVTPERQVVDEAGVSEVQLPGAQGYLGILPGHAPLLTELGIGELSYRKGKEVCYATVIRGYAEVLPDRVSVLAEVAERAEEVDVDRARAALEDAEKRLAKPYTVDIDWDAWLPDHRQAKLDRERALIRLQVAAKGAGAVVQGEQQPAP